VPGEGRHQSFIVEGNADATVDDEGAIDRHAYLAYQHQLNGVRYAEIAALNRESMEEELTEEDFDA
jgi:hypothetical protein